MGLELFYLFKQQQGFDHFKVRIAVPVQLMIQSEVSGIMFTVNPLTNNTNKISIEAGFGLGQTIVSGEITPDQYIVDKKDFAIKSKYISKTNYSRYYCRKGKKYPANIKKLKIK